VALVVVVVHVVALVTVEVLVTVEALVALASLAVLMVHVADSRNATDSVVNVVVESGSAKVLRINMNLRLDLRKFLRSEQFQKT
jgi:hypothetical protein